MSDIDARDFPSAAGFRMPPEWYPHSCTWLAWPHNQETWPHKLGAARAEFLQLVQAIAEDEPVVLIASDETIADLREAIYSSRLSDLPIWLNNIPTNDAWIRDYGPTFVTNGDQLLAIDWRYNAWGGKYPPYDQDQLVAARMIEQMPIQVTHEHVQRHVSVLHLEGGAIETNDDGVLICTRSCARNPNRNPGFSLNSIEKELTSCLGTSKIIWLGGDALDGDDTDGHIDQLARFVPGNRILFAWTQDAADSQYEALLSNREELYQTVSRCQFEYELVPLPLPDPLVVDNKRLPASYCNFYITNRSVIVPQFARPQDRNAIETISRVFPGRNVKGLPSSNLVTGLGSFHCLTQQQPKLRR